MYICIVMQHSVCLVTYMIKANTLCCTPVDRMPNSKANHSVWLNFDLFMTMVLLHKFYEDLINTEMFFAITRLR